jgi:hypothetical protein
MNDSSFIALFGCGSFEGEAEFLLRRRGPATHCGRRLEKRTRRIGQIISSMSVIHQQEVKNDPIIVGLMCFRQENDLE